MKFDLNDINFDWARNIWEDLKNKRLLPVAAVLVLALIAVPFVLGRSSTPPEPPVAVGNNVNVEPELDPISVKQHRPDGQSIGGDPTNPFKQPSSGGSGSSTTTTASTAPATTTTGSGTGTSTTKTTTTPKKSSGPSTAYEINVKFGAPGNTTTRNNVAALTPFPSADNAYVVYLGAIDSGKTAVFLISTDVKATGDGICSPSETNCKTVEMQAGDTELFQVEDSATGTTTTAATEYELKVVKVHK